MEETDNGFVKEDFEFTKEAPEFTKEFTKETPEFTKEFTKETPEFTKEFVKASRQIYKLISSDPHITVAQMSDAVNLSSRQVLKYLKQLQEQQKIARVGGRKAGEWKIIDKEYNGDFDVN